MVMTIYRTHSKLTESNNCDILQEAADCYECPCRFTPPINAFTYCVLKKLCKRILKEICDEQKREVFTVFDGGRCSKYESLIKDKTQPSKCERQSMRSKDKLLNRTERRSSTVVSVDSQIRTKQSLNQPGSKTRKTDKTITVKEAKIKEKQVEQNKGKAQKEWKTQNEEKQQDKGQKLIESQEQLREEKLTKKQTDERTDRHKDKEKEQQNKEKRFAKVEKTNGGKSQVEQDKIESDNSTPSPTERQKVQRTTAKSIKQVERMAEDSVALSQNKKSRISKSGSQSGCGKRSRSLTLNRLDIDRDFTKRHNVVSCHIGDGQCTRFEQICISPNPCRRRYALGGIGSNTPCDYMPANMEYKEICCQRVLPPYEHCTSYERACLQYAQMPTDLCGSCPMSYAKCAV